MAGEAEIANALRELRSDIRADISEMRQEVNGRLDKMVSNDLFSAEQRSIDGRFRDMKGDVENTDKRVSEVSSDLTAEKNARKDAETAAAQAALATQRAVVDQQAKNRWLLFGLVASPILSIVVGYALSGGFMVAR